MIIQFKDICVKYFSKYALKKIGIHFGKILYTLKLMQVFCKNKRLQHEVDHTEYYTVYANV